MIEAHHKVSPVFAAPSQQAAHCYTHYIVSSATHTELCYIGGVRVYLTSLFITISYISQCPTPASATH